VHPIPPIVIPDDDPSVMAPSAAYSKLAAYEVRVHSSRPAGSSELISRIQDAEIVINIRSTSQFTKEVFARCPKLRLISIWGTGTDNVDLAAAKAAGVRVTNTPGVGAISVAEHALSLMLAVARQTIVVDRQVRAGKWPRAMVIQLYGKTMGLIGTGAIGSQVARLGKGIGMHVIAWSFHPNQDVPAEWVSFDEIFRRSDVVSVHVRQSPETVGMIGRKQFDLMKPSAIFINTARGPIVKEAELLDALRRKQIAGAGLDVFDTEPLAGDSPFLALPNVVLTPHAASITPEATEAGLAFAIENVFAFLAGQPANIVV